MIIAPKLLNCRINGRILLKTRIFFLIIFKKAKNRRRGSITLILFVKLVTHTLQNILSHLEAVLTKYFLDL